MATASPRSSVATGSNAAKVSCCATSPTPGARSIAHSPTPSTRAALEDVVEWLGELIRATDATLLEEWARLAGAPAHDHLAPEAPVSVRRWPPDAWRTAVRTAAFGWVELLAARATSALAERTGWSAERLTEAMADYWAEYDAIAIDADARSAAHFGLVEEADRWVITQRLADPAGDGEWRFVAVVDLQEAKAEGAPTLRLEHLGRF